MSDPSSSSLIHETPAGLLEAVDCISLIGMPGSGKSAIGAALARKLGWAHVDTDSLIEAQYGVRLQTVTDALDRETFLDVESAVICALRVQRAVISTGGSVVYRQASMEWLASLGPVLHLDVPLDDLLARIASKPDRGIVIAPGQTIEDLFRERDALYRRWASLSLILDPGRSVDENAEVALAALRDFVRDGRQDGEAR